MSETLRAPLRASSIAIVGMAARFPGASTLEEYWSNLVQGKESITFFSDDELRSAGVSPETIARPDYVKAAPVLDGVDLFDAGFFKISRREAEMMDPQQRILLELAWEAMERAGYAGDAFRGLVGVFAGAGGLMSSYLLSPHHLHARLIAGTGSMQCIGNDKDYLATRISYKLNLRGPSLTVQTACSTSLVAVHLACQSLLAGECDMALAGGVTVRVPHLSGYFHSSQALLSPDGHCRPFDATAAGTLFGSGAGLVLLKPLTKAVEDGDRIHAVIRGAAVNNDGAAKLSYWATSADGQAAAAADALAVAEVDAGSIGYLEAHGTATSMGDPVEIFGLTKAFRRTTEQKQYCAVGSVKSNFGHLEAAAGVASLIKAALALEHEAIPPSLHFHCPNPAIDFVNSPFFVNAQCRPWRRGAQPRRAAVNSLGIGGTNAHVILEEAPLPERTTRPPERPAYLLTLSARTPAALTELAGRYAGRLAQGVPEELGDLCFTAGVGRGHFAHRVAMVGATSDEMCRRLEAWVQGNCRAATAEGTFESAPAQAVFVFSGQGSQYPGMGRELYQTLPVFRRAIHRCQAILEDQLERPLLAVLFPEGPQGGWLDKVSLAQPALFALEYALAEVWKSWGVEPSALVGHGVGEYVAACLAGVFSLEEALGLVASRAGLIQNLPDDGRMLAVISEPDQIQAWLYPADELWLAAVNGPRQVVVSGSENAVTALAERLRLQGIRSLPLPHAHAFHSPRMEPVLEGFSRACQGVRFQKPRMRVISGLTGKAGGEEMASADYWRRHLCEPVRFADGIMTLEEQGYRVFLEIGPRPRLRSVGRRCLREWSGLWLASLRQSLSDWESMLSSLAALYVEGVRIDWEGLERGMNRRRLPLPAYPFQRQRYWVGDKDRSRHSGLLALLAEGKLEEVADRLKATEDLTDDEVLFLPRLLRALAAPRGKPQVAESPE